MKSNENSQPSNQEPAFKESIEQLRAIVEKLEQEQLPLEEMMTLYQDGIKLSESCTRILTEAELKFETLRQTEDRS